MANEIQKHLMIVPAAQTTAFVANHVGSSVNSSDPYYAKVAFLEETQEIVAKGKKYAINSKNINDVLMVLLGADGTDSTKIATPAKSLAAMLADITTATTTGMTFAAKDIASADANITINYQETNGVVTINSITPIYATITRTARTEDTDHHTLTAPALAIDTTNSTEAAEGTKLVKASDLMLVKHYADDIVAKVKQEILTGDAGGAIEAAYDTLQEIATWIANNDNVADAQGIVYNINQLQTKQTTAEYSNTNNTPVLSYTGYDQGHQDYLLKASSIDAIKNYVDAKVTIAENAASDGINDLDVSTYTVTAGQNISFSYTETNGIVTIDGLQEQYAAFTYGTNDGTTLPTFAITKGDGEKLVKGKDIAALKNYTAAAILNLDATVTSTNGTFTNVTVTETDGKITAVSVTTSYADVVYTAKNGDTPANLAPTTATGVMIGSDITAIKNYVDAKTGDLDTLLNGLDTVQGAGATKVIESTTYQYSYVSVSQENGAITGMTAYHTIGAVSGSTGNVTTNGLIDADALSVTLSQLDLWCEYTGEGEP